MIICNKCNAKRAIAEFRGVVRCFRCGSEDIITACDICERWEAKKMIHNVDICEYCENDIEEIIEGLPAQFKRLNGGADPVDLQLVFQEKIREYIENGKFGI